MKATALALAVLASAPAADEWLVDDDGGPGVDFTDIQPAIDAAQPGDRILVAGGSYGGFDLTKGISIEGDSTTLPYTTVNGFVLIHGVPADQVVFLGNVHLEASLLLRKCPDTVLIEDVQILGDVLDYSLRVTYCDDVRVYRSDIRSSSSMPQDTETLQMIHSRLELVQTFVAGRYGSQQEPGGPAIALQELSELLVTLCRVVGGAGALPTGCGDPFGDQQGGDGGDAIHVLSNATVRIAGPTPSFPAEFDVGIVGGPGGGCGDDCSRVGEPGFALRVEPNGLVLYSSTPLLGGDVFGCYAPPAVHVEPSGAAALWDPFEPTLWVGGDVHPGGTVSIELSASTAKLSALAVGFEPIFLPVPSLLNPITLQPTLFLPLGSDTISFQIPLPASFPSGTLLHLQAAVTGIHGDSLTNSNTVYVE